MWKRRCWIAAVVLYLLPVLPMAACGGHATISTHERMSARSMSIEVYQVERAYVDEEGSLVLCVLGRFPRLEESRLKILVPLGEMLKELAKGSSSNGLDHFRSSGEWGLARDSVEERPCLDGEAEGEGRREMPVTALRGGRRTSFETDHRIANFIRQSKVEEGVLEITVTTGELYQNTPMRSKEMAYYNKQVGFRGGAENYVRFNMPLRRVPAHPYYPIANVAARVLDGLLWPITLHMWWVYAGSH